MADILASVSVVLGGEISGFKAAMAQARRELKGLIQFSEGLKDIGTSLTQYVSLPLAALGAASVAASGKIESLKKGLEAITLQELGKQGVTGLGALQEAAQQTTQRMAQLQEIAKQPGLGFEGAVQGDVRLRAVGISAEQSAKSIKAFANAIATTGGGKSEFDRVTVQLAQLSAKGKVLAQDLRPIIEAAPAVSGALQRLYGTVDSETISASLAKQGKSSTDFIAVLTDELAKLPQVSGGLKNAFENLADTATLSAAKLGDGISRALNLPGLLAGLSSGIASLSSSFAGLSPGVQKLVVGLGVIVAATGPVLVAVGTLGAALPAITAGFATLGVSSLAALAPILPIAAAVAAAALVVYENWDNLTAYFSATGEGGQVFSNLAASVTQSVASISQAFGQLGGEANTSLGGLIAATGIFKVLFRDIAVGITAISDVVGGTIGVFSNLAKGIQQAFNGEKVTGFAASLKELERAAFGVIDPLANLFGFTKKAQEGFEGAALGGGVFGDSLLHLSGILPGLNTQLQGFAGGLPQYGGALTAQAGLLEKLRERLKEVTDQREKETSAKAVSIDNELIKNLQAQIDALLGISKGAKQALKDISALKESLLGFRVADVVKAMFKVPEFKLEGLLPKKIEVPELAPIKTGAFTASINNATKQMALFQKTAEGFKDGISQVLEAGFESIAVNFGAAIGDIVTGASGIEALPAVLLGGIGDLAIKVGELAVGTGIAIAGIAAALESLNPVVAIAGGIALIALGTAVKGAASSLAKGGGSTSVANSAASSPKATNYGQTSNQQTIKIIAEFKLRGQDLAAVGQQQTYRSRVTG